MSYTVICTLPNVSTEINGIAFSDARKGKTAKDVPLAAARKFARITGYQVTPKPPQEGEEAADADAGPKSIEDMNVREIQSLLSDHPLAWADVLPVEEARDPQRISVIKAAEAARAIAEQETTTDDQDFVAPPVTQTETDE